MAQLRIILLLLGLVTLIALIWHSGPARIAHTVTQLGFSGLTIILLPSILIYGLDTLGWRFTLGQYSSCVPFSRLFLIRMAGEAVNLITPTAYLGGEPVKSNLLRRYDVPLADAIASVVTSKTTMTIAQIAYILIGIGLALWIAASSSNAVGPRGPAVFTVIGGLLSLLILSVIVLLIVQTRGLFTALLNLLKRLGVRIKYLEKRADMLRACDQAIARFYRYQPVAALLSTAAFFFGWLAESLEVYAILYYLHGPVPWVSVISIAALSILVKGVAFFIPGSLGAQEGGNLVLLVAYGFPEEIGISYALLRRLREVVWISGGLSCLAMFFSLDALWQGHSKP